jgi:hypothetical protein
LCPRCLFARLGEAKPLGDGPETDNRSGLTLPDPTLRPEFGDYELLEEIGQR